MHVRADGKNIYAASSTSSGFVGGVLTTFEVLVLTLEMRRFLTFLSILQERPGKTKCAEALYFLPLNILKYCG